MDGVQQLPDFVLQLAERDEDLFTAVPAGDDALVLLDILGADLHPEGHAFHLVLGGLPAHGLLGVVHPGADTGGLKARQKGGGMV